MPTSSIDGKTIGKIGIVIMKVQKLKLYVIKFVLKYFLTFICTILLLMTEFNLDRYQAGNVYLIQDTQIEVTTVITKKDNTLPLTTAKVGPINNVLHSLFSSVRLTINDVPITISPLNYPYKCYISNCLTYSSLVKAAQLSTEGWYSDFSGHFGATDSNAGFKERSELYREGYGSTTAYRKSGTTFFGRLMHDLISCTTGLPPNSKVKIELDRSDDAFVIMCEDSDHEQYVMKITNICLFVPVAELSQTVFSEINNLMTVKNKSIAIHYRRTEIRNITYKNRLFSITFFYFFP
jgi:hypothetical protein